VSDSYLGVDVGGTKVAVASLEDRRFSETRVEPTELHSSDALIAQLLRVIAEHRGASSRAVGIGVPSIVEFATGRIRHSVNIPLADVPLRALLTERVGLPVYVDNDANCAALAEAHEEGRLTGTQLVMMTVGTGVGGGMVLNGRVFRGATGAAPELGHVSIGLDLRTGAPEQDEWPRAGSLEKLASGSALDELAEAAARDHPDSALGRMRAGGAEVTGREAVAAAHEGDAVALGILDVLGQRLGIGIANAINTFDPFEVVIGGGVSAAGELLLEPARRTAARYTVPGVGTRTEIRLARHGADAGVHGAALMAAHEEEQP
jgi:glucokinase